MVAARERELSLTPSLLHDDALWQTLTPLIGAVKAFGEGLNRGVHKPVTAFTGQETKQS